MTKRTVVVLYPEDHWDPEPLLYYAYRTEESLSLAIAGGRKEAQQAQLGRLRGRLENWRVLTVLDGHPKLIFTN